METAIDFYNRFVHIFMTTEQIELIKDYYELAKLKEKHQIQAAYLAGFVEKNVEGSVNYYKKTYINEPEQQSINNQI